MFKFKNSKNFIFLFKENFILAVIAVIIAIITSLSIDCLAIVFVDWLLHIVFPASVAMLTFKEVLILGIVLLILQTILGL